MSLTWSFFLSLEYTLLRRCLFKLEIEGGKSMEYDEKKSVDDAEESFLKGLHRTAISREEFLARKNQEQEEWRKEAEALAALGKKEELEIHMVGEDTTQQDDKLPLPEVVEEVKTEDLFEGYDEKVSKEIVTEDRERIVIPVELPEYIEIIITDIKEHTPAKLYIEEDVLVPDVMPDMDSILLMEGDVLLHEKEYNGRMGKEENIKLSGEISLRTLYIPASSEGKTRLCNISSKIPLRTDWAINGNVSSKLYITAQIIDITHEIINERKFRAKITIELNLRGFSKKNVKFFEGIADESLEKLREPMVATDLAERKCHKSDINEEFLLKEDMPEPENVLAYDLNISMNHKQLTQEKAIINATIYIGILYSTSVGPRFFQDSLDLTRFIPIEVDSGRGNSQVYFDLSKLKISMISDIEDEEVKNGFRLEGELETCLEIYETIVADVVTDFYHQDKEIVYTQNCKSVTAVMGNGIGETSVREIVNTDAELGEIMQVLYVKGRICENTTSVEQEKAITKGKVNFIILCEKEGDEAGYFVLEQEIPFRIVTDIAGLSPYMTVKTNITLKNMWFDRINSKQVEINAGIELRAVAYQESSFCIFEDLGMIPVSDKTSNIVLYIVKSSDSLWNIAKCFRTSMDSLIQINDMENNMVYSGQKLLIIK